MARFDACAPHAYSIEKHTHAPAQNVWARNLAESFFEWHHVEICDMPLAMSGKSCINESMSQLSSSALLPEMFTSRRLGWPYIAALRGNMTRPPRIIRLMCKWHLASKRHDCRSLADSCKDSIGSPGLSRTCIRVYGPNTRT